MMRFAVASLAVIVVNLLGTMAMQVCMVMRIPPPPISLGTFTTLLLLVDTIVWAATFRLLRDPVKSPGGPDA